MEELWHVRDVAAVGEGRALDEGFPVISGLRRANAYVRYRQP